MENFLEAYPSIEAARFAPGQIVYGLADQSGIFYIGKATNPDNRFRGYVRRLKNLDVIRRITAAGPALQVLVLERNPADLAAAEAAMISRYGLQLVNYSHNGARSRHRGGLKGKVICRGCPNPINIKSSDYCRSCLDKLRAA